MSILNDYVSPTNETSLYKDIPIVYRYHPDVIAFMKSGKYRIKYRGPRHDWGAKTCLLKNAKRFAIYERSEEVSHEKYMELHRAYMETLKSYQQLFNAFSNLEELPQHLRYLAYTSR